MQDRLHAESERLLEGVSRFLCDSPRAITPEDLAQLGVPQEEGCRLMLAAYLGLDLEQRADAALYRACFPEMLRLLNPSPYRQDPYALAVGAAAGAAGGFRLGRDRYAPCELFVRDDMVRLPDGHVIPRLGWFAEEYAFPALWEDGRLWMSVTPNEVQTIRPLAARSRGRVLCLGLGLGYYAFHALACPEVESVTVVERDAALIGLFDRLIRPAFGEGGRLRIIRGDAFDAVRAMKPGTYETVFADLWHDAGDGLPMYERLKAMETPGPQYLDWI